MIKYTYIKKTEIYMYHIIVNPTGGKGKSLKALGKVEELLKKNGAEYTIHKTEYAGHATEIARELSQTPDTKIIAMGGDGSFHEVLCGIDNFDNVTLGLIACGSGNDFIKKSGHSAKIEEAVATILKDKPSYVDYMELGKYRCLNVGGGGMDVDVLLKYAQCKTLKGKHVGTDWGGEYTAKKITIEALDDSRFELDGEIIDDTKLDIEVVHGKLKMYR